MASKECASVKDANTYKYYVKPNLKEAWNLVDWLFPTDYKLDNFSTFRTDHSVYRSTVSGDNSWIDDFGDVLEVNAVVNPSNIVTTTIYIMKDVPSEEALIAIMNEVDDAWTSIKNLKFNDKVKSMLHISELDGDFYMTCTCAFRLLCQLYPNSDYIKKFDS